MELTPAFVLHQRPYRETSLLLEVLTASHGRLHLIAKGVRGKRKKQSGFAQLFQAFQLSWYGRGDLLTVSNYEVLEPAYRLTGQASLCGLYLNELLVKLLPPHEAEPAIYEAYQNTLIQLQTGEQTEIHLRLFEKHLLLHLGYGLSLSHEADSETPISEEQHYLYVTEQGAYRQARPTDKTISGRSLKHLQEEQGFDEQSLAEIKRLMRQLIDYYLAGRPLQSRQLFAQLKQFHSQPNQ